MATADEIRAEIEARYQYGAHLDMLLEGANQEIHEAEERQRLRRQLDVINGSLAHKRSILSVRRDRANFVDKDLGGPAPPAQPPISGTHKEGSDQSEEKTVERAALDCDEAVRSREIEWSVKGFSWLKATLTDTEIDWISSPAVGVAEHQFQLCYSPTKGEMGDHDQRASLAIFHEEPAGVQGVTFRYTISIKSKDRGFIQWGRSGNVCTVKPSDNKLFGPDVCKQTETPRGLFGMSHEELLSSEWVADDTLTAKLNVLVRPKVDFIETEFKDAVVTVPSSNNNEKLLQLFESGVNSDVVFVIQGEEVKAHSVILSAFSEVFQRQFACGMEETTSKRVVIEDCEPTTFKAFLRYLYSSDFAHLGITKAETTSTGTGSDHNRDTSSSSKSIHSERMNFLRQVLALSHKYQETRLLRWTERELSEHITIEDVCPVLCQAHLYEAKVLEEKCLAFIVANKNAVAKSDAFGTLSHEWPQVNLKIALRLAGVSDDSTAIAMKNHENARKRKRSD